MGRHPGDQVIDGSCDLPPDRSFRVFDQGVDTAADEFWLIDRRPACPVGRVVAVTQRGGLPLQQERAPPHDNARAVVQVQAHGDLWRSLDRGHRPYLRGDAAVALAFGCVRMMRAGPELVKVRGNVIEYPIADWDGPPGCLRLEAGGASTAYG